MKLKHECVSELVDFAAEVGDSVLKTEILIVNSYAQLRSNMFDLTEALDSEGPLTATMVAAFRWAHNRLVDTQAVDPLMRLLSSL